MQWIPYAILAATSYGFYNFFVKMSAGKLSPTIAIMFLTGTAFIIATISTLVLKVSGQNLIIARNAILFPILAGLFAGIAEIFYLIMYSKEAPLSIGLPLIMGGTMLVAIILGLVVLKEGFNTAKTAGIILVFIGIIFLSRS